VDISALLRSLFPTATDAFVVQANATFLSIISKASAATLESLVNVFIELPVILLNIVILGFVFFFTLRDREYFLEFLSGLSPLNKAKQSVLSKQFKDITDSLLYGHVVVGIIQGLIAGVGFLIFGIDNALILTIVAVILSIMPILGPFLIWAPINIYMYATGDPQVATLYLAYNLILVSTADNFLRAYIVSRKSDVSQVVLMIGMIGGLLVFGIPGLIIGPLILAYFLTFLKAYKERTLSSLFSSE
jgi:predicted PurR-regulated permease PerM